MTAVQPSGGFAGTAGRPPVRWGVIGTAGIARRAFVPAVRAAGRAEVVAVAGRDRDRTGAFARELGIARPLEGYQAAVEAPDLDALYVALPNALHAEWTIAALEAGKAVLCEKPLCGTLADTERVLAAARRTGSLLWEAFVFPFHPQTDRIRALLAEGAIGELREIQSSFHFLLERPGDIRLSAALEGGALNDVGCYPVRLTVDLFGAAPEAAAATAVREEDGVDVELSGTLAFSGERLLAFSCGFRRAPDTFTRLLGTSGRIHVTNPYHPGPEDTVEVWRRGQGRVIEPGFGVGLSFVPALRHIDACLLGEEAPRLLAVDTAGPVAAALEMLARSAENGRDVPAGT